MNWYLKGLRNYADFSGRAQRMEYWMFVLFSFIFTIVLIIIESFLGLEGEISGLFALAMMIPSSAVTFRRFHDTDHSGWWFLIWMVPIIGTIIFLVFMVQDSQTYENRFGPNPKAITA